MSITSRVWDESSVMRDRVGRFAEKNLTDSGTDIDLSMPAPVDATERAQAIIRGKYAPPTRTAPAAPTATTRQREKYWTDAFATAEYNHKKGVYAQMPDSYGKGHGRGLDGTRRVHRMRYTGDDVSLRMPSASAIKRFAKAQQGRTFDVPVAAEYPGGAVQGWVRVTPGPNNTFEVEGLDFDDTQNAYVAESVRAVLEGRRPSRALTEVGDILAHRKKRIEGTGAAMRPIASGALSTVGYDNHTGTMVVTFKRDDTKGYGYKIDRETYDAVVSSESPGRSYVYDVKQSAAERVTVERCEACGRFSPAEGEHFCGYRPGERDANGFVTNARAAEALSSLAKAKTPAAKPEPESTPTPPAPTPEPATPARTPQHGTPVTSAFDLKPGEKVIVTDSGRTYEMTVQSAARGDGPEGKFGNPAHWKATVGFGPGRYNTEVSQARLDAGFIQISRPPVTPETSGEPAGDTTTPASTPTAKPKAKSKPKAEPTPEPTPAPVTPRTAKSDPQGWFDAAASSTPAAQGVFGSRGHTREAFRALAPYLTEESDEQYAGFTGVSGKQRLAHITKNLTNANLAHRATSGAPRTIDVLKAAYQHGDQISFGGQAVSPGREDERIEINTVYLSAGDTDEKVVRRKIANGFPGSAEPASVTQVEAPWHPSGSAWAITW